MATSRRIAVHRRLAGYAANLAIVAVTLLGAAFVLPSVMGFERYVLTGGSMDGTYDKGSLVFERPVPADQLEVGDVITYQPPASSGLSTLVTHRIVKIGRDPLGGQVLQTKGDANQDVDPWQFSLTAQEQPVVAFSVPHVGWALIALADREMRMLIVGIPAALVALLSLGQLIGALRSRPDRLVVGTTAPVEGSA